eukprot:1072444-Rhodomonas_salina.1
MTSGCETIELPRARPKYEQQIQYPGTAAKIGWRTIFLYHLTLPRYHPWIYGSTQFIKLNFVARVDVEVRDL